MAEPQEDASAPWLVIDRIYADASGETHFVKCRIPQERLEGVITRAPRSIPFATPNVSFRALPGGADIHHSKERQFVVVLTGRVDVTVSDGEHKFWGRGEVFLASDAGPGEGHRTQTLHGLTTFLMVPVDPAIDLDAWNVKPGG